MIEVPGKVFLFGEYSVMLGGESIVAALKPSYRFIPHAGHGLHPESPAGSFLSEQKKNLTLKTEGGLGSGFGSSTAELIAVNQQTDVGPWIDQALWSWYREKHAPASGADLAVQMQSAREGTGFYQFQIQDSFYRIQKINVPFLFQTHCLIYRCPSEQKIPTYSDLEKQRTRSIELKKADTMIHRWLNSFDPRLLTEWAEELASQGYESLFGHQVRTAFQKVRGVTGVKGCGAGLNDVFLVCLNDLDPSETMKEIRKVENDFKLELLGRLSDHV